MKICSTCQSVNVKQTSSILTRLLLSTYMFLAYYFFTGDIGYGALFMLVPLFIPYMYICTNCETSFFRLPKVNNYKNFGVRSKLDKYFIALVPSILSITSLIVNFPNTGLGRIVYLPSIFFINSLIIIFGLFIYSKLNKTFKILLWLTILIITVMLSVLSYPQVSRDGILELIFTKEKH
ncbi:hypothetical protein ABEW34_00020 [Paenibacillus algorifonticola]|uniref:hypothetical protein n=1 Tax=Paenibacillus algorifonticola TaxID=684063 RepID=UPI003D295A42